MRIVLMIPLLLLPLMLLVSGKIQERNDALLGIVTVKQGKSVVVAHVLKDSPASSAGLKVGDVLIRVNGRRITDPDDVDKALASAIWLKEKLYRKSVVRKELATLSGSKHKELPELLFSQHHQSYAASAFCPSPFDRAAVLCMGGVGEWTTTSVWLGDGAGLTPQWQIDFPHSVGLLYSAFT